MDVVIFDIDGTMSNSDHRVKYVRTEPKNWQAFFNAAINDKIIEPVCEIFRTIRDKTDDIIVIATGRNEENRDITEQWLNANGLSGYEKLYMRGSNDYKPDFEVKREILEQIRSDFNTDPKMVFDDRPSVVRMWREEGLFVFNVYQGEDDF